MSNHFVHREPPDAKEKRERIVRAVLSRRDESEEEGKKGEAAKWQDRLPTRPLTPDRPEEEERA